MKKQKSIAVDAAVDEAPQRWKFSAEQYQQMGEADIFRKEDRVELLEGEIYQMTPVGSWHVDSLTMTFAAALTGRAIVRVQGSFRLSPSSEPEPDLLVLRFRPDFYRSALPGPEDVLLLVEVADRSLGYDRRLKLPLYARGGISELWIVNRRNARVEVYRDPTGDGYETVSFSESSSSVSPLAFPELRVAVKDILG